LCEVNNGIHIYQFTFDLYTSVSGCGCSFGFEQKYWRIDGFGEKKKKARIDGFAYPYSPLPLILITLPDSRYRLGQMSSPMRNCGQELNEKKWIGHTLKNERENTTRMTMAWNPQGKRKQERPKP